MTLAILLLLAAAQAADAPRVLETVPASGDLEVDPALTELRVTFDQDMRDGSFSWVGGGPTFPEVRGKPHWIDARTCVLPVTLVADHSYRVGINGGRFTGFQSESGVPAVPVLLDFRTAGGKELAEAEVRTAIATLRRLIDERYSYRDRLGLDWDALFAEHAGAMSEARKPHAFAIAAVAMLAAAQDPHLVLWVGEEPVPTHRRNVAPNVDFSVLEQAVPGLEQDSQVVAHGRFEDDIGYLRIDSWDRSRADDLAALAPALEALSDCHGLILDVRANGGGDEELAKRFAGHFIDERATYARNVWRDPDSESGWSQVYSRELDPVAPRYGGEVAVLSGPLVMSSCEAFLLMMKQSPGCVLVGAISAGSSGNPRRHDLGIGVEVALPAWRALTASGEDFEGAGIRPDLAVSWSPGAGAPGHDPVLDAALEHLRRR